MRIAKKLPVNGDQRMCCIRNCKTNIAFTGKAVSRFVIRDRHLLEDAVQENARLPLLFSGAAHADKTVADREQGGDVIKAERFAFGSDSPAVATERQKRKIGIRQCASHNVPQRAKACYDMHFYNIARTLQQAVSWRLKIMKLGGDGLGE
jgi:hypothetical protein